MSEAMAAVERAVRFGIKINKNEEDSNKRVTYLYDAAGMIPAVMDFVEGTFNYGSWGNVEFVKNNYPCMVKFDGTEDYRLNPDNYELKEDGAKSDITDIYYAGNAMSAFKGGWLCQYETATDEYIIWSNVKYDAAYNAYHRTGKDGTLNAGFYRHIYTPSLVENVARSLSGCQTIGDMTAEQENEACKANGDKWGMSSWWEWNYIIYRRGYRVLLIDNDKQGNLSKAYSRYDAENIAPVTKLLAGDWCNVDELIQHTDYEGIDIVTANMSLFGATWNLTKEDSENQIERYKTLVYAKVQYYGNCTVYGKYDYCIIDNPPDIGLNVVNALAITDEVIVPVKVDEDALEGLDIVTEQIEDAKAFNPALKLAGVLITSYQNTDGEAAGVEWLEQNTDFNILGIIRYSKKVAENTFLRKPIYEYSPCCAAAQGYKKFVTAYTGKAR